MRRSGEWTPLARRWGGDGAVADLLLDNVEAGHDRPTALFIRVTERITGMALPDVVKVTSYRHRSSAHPLPIWFRRRCAAPRSEPWPSASCSRRAPRSSTRARSAFRRISRLRPRYGGAQVAAAVDAPQGGAVRAEAQAALVFLDKLAVDPASVGAQDAAAVVKAGVPTGALEQAVRIAVLFHVINRVMNGLGSTAMPERQQRVGVRLIRLLGYRSRRCGCCPAPGEPPIRRQVPSRCDQGGPHRGGRYFESAAVARGRDGRS